MTKQERRRERPLITRIDAKRFSCRKLICVNLRHSRANLLSVSSAASNSLAPGWPDIGSHFMMRKESVENARTDCQENSDNANSFSLLYCLPGHRGL